MLVSMFKCIYVYFKIQPIKNVRFHQYSTIQKIDKTKRYNYENRRKYLDFSLELKQIRSVFPAVVNEVLQEQLFYHKIYPELKERYSNMIKYMCDLDDNYLSESVMFLTTYKHFEKPSLLTEENLKKACILSWCFRLVDSSMLIDDDIIDNSKLRYKKPSWYKLPGIGVNAAICDASFLETSYMYLLINHLSSHPQFLNIQREMLRNYSCSMTAVRMDSLQYEFKDFEKYQNIIKAYPLIVPSVTCGMYLANIDDQRLHYVTKQFTMEVAEYLKVEDDVSCVFGSIEKDCTDAAEGRITWLAIQVLNRGTEAQKQILKKNYCKDDEASLMKIYKLYKEMGLEEQFEQYKQDFYEVTFAKIQNLPKELPKQLFLDILDMAMMGRLLT